MSLFSDRHVGKGSHVHRLHSCQVNTIVISYLPWELSSDEIFRTRYQTPPLTRATVAGVGSRVRLETLAVRLDRRGDSLTPQSVNSSASSCPGGGDGIVLDKAVVRSISVKIAIKVARTFACSFSAANIDIEI